MANMSSSEQRFRELKVPFLFDTRKVVNASDEREFNVLTDSSFKTLNDISKTYAFVCDLEHLMWSVIVSTINDSDNEHYTENLEELKTKFSLTDNFIEIIKETDIEELNVLPDTSFLSFAPSDKVQNAIMKGNLTGGARVQNIYSEIWQRLQAAAMMLQCEDRIIALILGVTEEFVRFLKTDHNVVPYLGREHFNFHLRCDENVIRQILIHLENENEEEFKRNQDLKLAQFLSDYGSTPGRIVYLKRAFKIPLDE